MLYPPVTLALNSTVAAARSRKRGPSISVQRAEEQLKELNVVVSPTHPPREANEKANTSWSR